MNLFSFTAPMAAAVLVVSSFTTVSAQVVGRPIDDRSVLLAYEPLIRADRKTGDKADAWKPIHEEQARYANATQLSEAIYLLKRKLEQIPGSADYAKLMNEESLKRALKVSIAGYKQRNRFSVAKAPDIKSREAAQRIADRFDTIIKPIYEEIAEAGAWPAGAFFEPRPRPNGFELVLHIDMREVDPDYELAPGFKPTGYAMQILKVEWGLAGPEVGGRGVLTLRP
jgi:hypothetical protein